MPAPNARWPRRLATAALAALVGLAGAWLALAAFGHHDADLGPFRVRFSSTFGRGDTTISLPPFGKLRADTHTAPLHVTVALQSVDVPRLGSELQQRGVSGLAEQVQEGAVHQVVPFALRLVAIAAAGALVLALLIYRRRWRRVGIAVLCAVLVVGGSEALARATYRPTALLHPRFSGSLALAPKLIGPAETALGRLEDFQGQLERIVGGAARLYGSIEASGLGDGDDIRVLHISDIHLSPLGLSLARQAADAFDVDFVIDTGDLTSFGTPAESLILRYISGFDRPYLFVRGNHDSSSLTDAMRRIPNVTVLDRTTKTVDGITVYGIADPVFTPDKSQALDDAEIATVVRTAEPDVAADVAAMPAPPTVVAVHDERMADSVAGKVPLVVSGHFHVTATRQRGGTLFCQVGTTGGAGADFLEDPNIPLSAEVLHFDRAAPHALLAWDVIEQSPENGSLTVERHLPSEPLPAEPSPSPTPSGASPAPTGTSPSTQPEPTPSVGAMRPR
jgi:predicted phosphodiesterase